jgi:alkylated DNA repair protein (DNA oxidative demethylase)
LLASRKALGQHLVKDLTRQAPNCSLSAMRDLFSAQSPIVLTLDRPAQEQLLDAVVALLAEAPLYRPMMPRSGKPLSVAMSNFGPLGWVTDQQGYRYQPMHPMTGRPWPQIPSMLLDLWAGLARYPAPPEACLVNLYGPVARMGMHQDRDEEDFDAPVLSVSLGDTARFRIGGLARSDPSETFELVSGDVMMLTGPTRQAFHGVDRILPQSSDLLGRHPALFPDGGRLNLTLRRVHPPSAP